MPDILKDQSFGRHLGSEVLVLILEGCGAEDEDWACG